MILSVHQPQYLPWLGYFHKIAQSDTFIFLDDVQYKEREFQNRNKVRTQKGALWLTVPVLSKDLGRQMIADVRIDNSTDWQNKHWESLKTWYGRAEFFQKYAGFFEELYRQKWESLSELNLKIINFVINTLNICKTIGFESDLNITEVKTDRIIAICKKLGADTYLSGIGGREYLEEDKFKQANIKLIYQDFKHPVYRQQFMKDAQDFMPYLSIVDLLFNEGGNSAKILGLSS